MLQAGTRSLRTGRERDEGPEGGQARPQRLQRKACFCAASMHVVHEGTRSAGMLSRPPATSGYDDLKRGEAEAA